MPYMSEYFSALESEEGFSRVNLHIAFDAEIATPHLVDQVALVAPQIRDLMASLRHGLPLMPHSGVGPMGGGGFFRLPNHYRSISHVLKSRADNQSAGVVVFKGTEPLIPDFPSYLEWMLEAPFRFAQLAMGLHFSLEMKLPPAAMWIEECLAEQRVASGLQQRYLDRYGVIARLPVPLFVFKMNPEQNASYREVVRAKLSADAFNKIKNKISDGLGIEVYFYPELPVRVADLPVGNVRETFKAALGLDQVEETIGKWTRLFAEMLCLDVMPYAPWHSGMGSCVDYGNACIDGGFNDLLTLVSFDAIPSDRLFRSSLQESVRMLADTIVTMAAVSLAIPPAGEPDVVSFAAEYVREKLREHVLEIRRRGYTIDDRLTQFFFPPSASDVLGFVRTAYQKRLKPAQYLGAAQISQILAERAALKSAVGA